MSKVTKATKAFNTVQFLEGAPPKDVISELVTVLGMARRGASTYYYNAKRAIAAEKNNAKNAKRREQRAAKKLSSELAPAVDAAAEKVERGVDSTVQAEIEGDRTVTAE